MKRTTTVFLPNDFTLTSKQVKSLEKSFRENWGHSNDYNLSNFNLIEEAMRTGLIGEDEGYGVMQEDGNVAF